MYIVYIACVSVVLACLAWMAASDMLALNKKEFTAVVTLPMSIFQSETVDTYDEEGNKTGTKPDKLSRQIMIWIAIVAYCIIIAGAKNHYSAENRQDSHQQSNGQITCMLFSCNLLFHKLLHFL